MKNKGFTLVEILGVMTLLGIIFALVYPNVINLLDKGEERNYKEYKENICLSAEAYIHSNINVDTSNAFNNGENVEIHFYELVSSGFLSSNVVDPSNNKAVIDLGNNKVTVKLALDKSFDCNIVSEG